MRVVEVAVDRAGEKTFHYALPEEIPVTVGSRVRIPFRSGERKGTIVAFATEGATPTLKEILGLLPGGTLDEEAMAIARFLERHYVVSASHSVLPLTPPPEIASRGEIWALVRPGEEASLEAEALRKRSPKRAEVLETLIQGPRPHEEMGASDAVLSALAKAGWIERRSAFTLPPREAAATLRQDQDEARDRLRGEGETLLFGVTGSGKTEVYLAAIEERLQDGQGAVVLVPEIALTPQLIDRFRRRFGDTVAALHSRLAGGERSTEMRRIREGRARVVIGARSAVFAPLPSPGLFILDEAHESSFQQEESPRYHTLEVARFRALRSGARLVQGSATPDVVSYYRAKKGEMDLIHLSRRFGPPMPKVDIVDLRKFGRQALTPPLLSALRETLARGEQAILFLNRRGFHPVLLCRECGESVKCPHCNVSLVLHLPEKKIICHACGYLATPPETCPACGGRRLAPLGMGTQRLELLVKEALPSAKVLRLDQDAVRRKGSYEEIYDGFREGRADILVGTQMVAKGFDFPGVGLVGAILADSSLRFPDYRASERTFQLVAQSAGRAGRRQQGRVIVQAYQPDHYALQSAARHDFEGFYEEEIRLREEAEYPPFVSLLMIGLSGPDEEKTSQAAERVADVAREMGDLRVQGPAPAILSKVRDRYRFQIQLKHASRERLTDAGRECSSIRLPQGVRLALLFDPMNLL